MKAYISVLTLLLLTSACKQGNEHAATPSTETTPESIIVELKQGGFAHTVYFWLHRPDNAEDRAAFEASIKKFILNSPDITTRHIGTPADTDRGVIDTSYTYSLLLTFEDKAAQDRYQVDPAHILFIEESSALWSKVIVYDSENILD